MYNVILLYTNGTSATLSVKNRTSWKTKRSAIKHAIDVSKGKCADGILTDCLEVRVENECGDVMLMVSVTQ